MALDVARRSVPGPYLAGASRARRALRGHSPSGRVGTARPKSPLPQLSARLFNSAPRVLDRLCGQLCWYTLAPPAGLGRRSSAYHHHHDPCHCKRSGHAAGVPVRPSSQLSRARRVNIHAARLAAVWRSHRLSAPAPEPARRLSSPVSFGTGWDHSLSCPALPPPAPVIYSALRLSGLVCSPSLFVELRPLLASARARSRCHWLLVSAAWLGLPYYILSLTCRHLQS